MKYPAWFFQNNFFFNFFQSKVKQAHSPAFLTMRHIFNSKEEGKRKKFLCFSKERSELSECKKEIWSRMICLRDVRILDNKNYKTFFWKMRIRIQNINFISFESLINYEKKTH